MVESRLAPRLACVKAMGPAGGLEPDRREEGQISQVWLARQAQLQAMQSPSPLCT